MMVFLSVRKRIKRMKNKKSKRFVSVPISITEETGKTVTFQLKNGIGSIVDSYGKKIPFVEGVSTRYQGDNKIRTVNTVFVDNIYFDATHAISEFEKLMIIDTNTKKIKDKTVAIGVMILCDVKVFKDSFSITPISLLTDCFFDSWSPNLIIPMKYENYMWSNFLSIIRDLAVDNLHSKTALIVDSDLGNLSKYNDHKTQFFNGLILPNKNPVLVLPENMTMFYAKSDKPNDSVLNGYVSCCDEMSNKIFFNMMHRIVSKSIINIDRQVVMLEFQKEKESLNNNLLECLKKRGLLADN